MKNQLKKESHFYRMLERQKNLLARRRGPFKASAISEAIWRMFANGLPPGWNEK